MHMLKCHTTIAPTPTHHSPNSLAKKYHKLLQHKNIHLASTTYLKLPEIPHKNSFTKKALDAGTCIQTDKDILGLDAQTICHDHTLKEKEDFLSKIDMEVLRQGKVGDQQHKGNLNRTKADLTGRLDSKLKEQRIKRDKVFQYCSKQMIENYRRKLADELQNSQLDIMKHLKSDGNRQSILYELVKDEENKKTKCGKSKEKGRNSNKFSLIYEYDQNQKQNCLPLQFTRILNNKLPSHLPKFKPCNFLSTLEQQKVSRILNMSIAKNSESSNVSTHAGSLPYISESFLQ